MTAERRVRRTRGSALIEFVLCSLVWLPLLLGTIFVGINVARSIEVTQICRDAGHMYAYSVDFSQPGNQAVLVQLSTGFQITPTGGNGVYILSTVMFVGSTQCQAGGYKPDSSSCPNLSHTVFTRRQVVGNSSLLVSAYGTPNTTYMDSAGSISATGYLTDTGARAYNLPTSVSAAAGTSFYVAEAYFSSPDLNWNTFTTEQGIYCGLFF